MSSSSSTATTTSTIADKTFKGVANLIKLLPSGTVFAFRYLGPLLTNGGQCSTANKCLTAALLVACGLTCFISTFTDSRAGSNGKVLYGLATSSGLCTFSSSKESSDFSEHKLKFRDFVHAFVSSVVLAVVALLDRDVVSCFYPSFELDEGTVIKVLPLVVGVVSSFVFVVFPSSRLGVGYVATKTTS